VIEFYPSNAVRKGSKSEWNFSGILTWIAAEQHKNSCGAASEAITSRSGYPPHNSMFN
jgi:hypothetical protein